MMGAPVSDVTREHTKEEAVPSVVHDDDRSSLSSYDAQVGVKNIEAISQTWTQWALISAYLG
jgi:hypothetical protein